MFNIFIFMYFKSQSLYAGMVFFFFYLYNLNAPARKAARGFGLDHDGVSWLVEVRGVPRRELSLQLVGEVVQNTHAVLRGLQKGQRPHEHQSRGGSEGVSEHLN